MSSFSTRNCCSQSRNPLFSQLFVLGRHARKPCGLRIEVRSFGEPQEEIADPLSQGIEAGFAPSSTQQVCFPAIQAFFFVVWSDSLFATVMEISSVGSSDHHLFLTKCWVVCIRSGRVSTCALSCRDHLTHCPRSGCGTKPWEA